MINKTDISLIDPYFMSVITDDRGNTYVSSVTTRETYTNDLFTIDFQITKVSIDGKANTIVQKLDKKSQVRVDGFLLNGEARFLITYHYQDQTLVSIVKIEGNKITEIDGTQYSYNKNEPSINPGKVIEVIKLQENNYVLWCANGLWGTYRSPTYSLIHLKNGLEISNSLLLDENEIERIFVMNNNGYQVTIDDSMELANLDLKTGKGNKINSIVSNCKTTYYLSDERGDKTNLLRLIVRDNKVAFLTRNANKDNKLMMVIIDFN